MKLINKKTGEKANLIVDGAYKFVSEFVVEKDDGTRIGTYSSLAELNADWEDVPKELPCNPWEEVAMFKELPSGLKIADRDYYEILPDGTKKTKFTWDEAMEIEKKTNGRWRLPLSKELNQIAIDLGYNDEGNFDGELLADNLGVREKLDKLGYMEYWSRALGSGTFSRSLLFGSTYLFPTSYYNKGYGGAVRCVAVPAES